MKLCSNCKIKPDYLDRIDLSNNLRADVYQCSGCHQLIFYRPRGDWGGKATSNFENDLLKMRLKHVLKKYDE